MRGLPPSTREHLGLALGLLCATAAATWPVVARMGSALPGDLGDPVLNTWILAWDAGRLGHAFRGLWDAPIFFPATRTLTWSEHLLGIAVPLAPLQWLTGNPVLVYNVAFLASYVLAGVGAYVLARELGLGRAASVVGACGFAFAPYRTDEMTHLQVLMTGWAPLALAALHRYLRSAAPAALAAFVLAFALLALSNTYYLFFFALPVAALAIYGLVVPRIPRRKAFAGLVAAAAAIAAILAPVMLAYWRTRQSIGLTRAWDEIADLSARPADYVAVAMGSWLWRGTLPVAPAEHALFPGLTIVILAAAGAAYAVRKSAKVRPETRATALLYLGIAAIAVWASLGPRGGLYAAALWVVPGLTALRMVTRIFSVVTLALSVLAAIGADALFSGRSRRAAITGAAVVVLLILAEGLAAPVGMAAFDPRLPPEARPMYTWLRQQPRGAVLEIPIAGPGLQPFTTMYQYATLVHGHPIVNGYSGSGSALQDFLASRNSPIYEPQRLPELIAALRVLGVRYVIAHPAWMASATRAEWLKSAMATCGDQIVAIFYGGDAIAWRLKDVPAPSALRALVTVVEPLQAVSYALTASSSSADTARVSDGNLETRWTSGAPQSGHEWLRADFLRPTDVAGLVLQIGWRRISDYPRGLLVESIADGRPPQVLFDGSTLPMLLPALVAPGPFVQLNLSLPPNDSRALVIRQTRTAPTPWSVDELQLWARRAK